MNPTPHLSNTSPYESVAHLYIERDLPVIPAMPAGKVPGVMVGGSWRPMSGWQQFADRMPTEQEVDAWSQFAGANICMPLGGVSNLVAVDIDMDGPVLQALEFALQGFLTCRKKGAKGFTAFMQCGTTPWRGKNNLQSKWNITRIGADGKPEIDPQGRVKQDRAVDIIGYGKQTVLPPSMHPNGMRYEWLTELRLGTSVDDYDLPVCPPDLCERITRALAPFQTQDDRLSDRDQRVMQGVTPGDSWFRDLNNYALANLHAWAPYVMDEAHAARYLERHGDGYRMYPYWRGVIDSAKVSLTSQGIRDFAEDKGYTPIDLVCAIRTLPAAQAIDWLQSRVKMPSPISMSITPAFAAAMDLGLSKSAANGPTMHAVQVDDSPIAFDPATGEVQTRGTVIEVPRVSLPKCMPPPDFTVRLPGMLGNISSWISSTAYRPIPTLSSLAAISFAGTMMARMYVGPTGLSTNCYLLGIAPSGSGKDHCLKAVARLLIACEKGDFVGGESIASGAGLLARLSEQPNTVYALDEFGKYLQSMMDPNGGGHMREITKYMLSLSGTLSPSFKGKDYADPKARKLEISYPSLNIFGVTTGASYYPTLTRELVADGFLGRFVPLEIPDDVLPPKNRDLSLDSPSGAILEWCGLISNPTLPQGSTLIRAPICPVKVPFANAAAKTVMLDFEDMADRIWQQLYDDGDGLHPLTRRWNEHALKLALIAGGAIDPVEPKITVAAAEWACQFVHHAMDRLIDATRTHISDSSFDRIVKDCAQALVRAGKRGLTERQMNRNSRPFARLQPSQVRDVLARLQNAGLAVCVPTTKTLVYYAETFAPPPPASVGTVGDN